MHFYKNEIDALKKRGLFRERKIYPQNLIDLASNDYLGVSQISELFESTILKLKTSKDFSPKASMLVNGYNQIHQEFEKYISKLNKFESAIIVGSGFLANFGLVESLVRNNDEIFMDSEYHASGVVATRVLKNEQVFIFDHNSSSDLEKMLKNSKAKRKIIAVEGIYSMSGDTLKREFFDIADKYEAILIVDEAHSFGVIGDSLLGIFDFYNITPKCNHIKMGTLGKAIGSYGAYILASKEIISFLENRSKPIIYSTAPSVFETLLSHFTIKYIVQHSQELKQMIQIRKDILESRVGMKKDGLIFPILIKDSNRVIEIKNILEKVGFLVGAIRPPTVKQAILRVIVRGNISIKDLHRFLDILENLQIY